VGEGLDEPVIVAEFIASCRTRFGIPHAIACRALGVSQSWFYKWINRAPTVRQQRRAVLDEEIKRLFTASGGTYGSPRITDDLREAGWRISVNTVAARMVELPARAQGSPGVPDRHRRPHQQQVKPCGQ
jgi:putative transposase